MKVEKADLERIKNILKETLGKDSFTSIERMGGLTNRTYCVSFDVDEKYVIRIPGEGTEKMIDRSDEKISTELACKIGIDADLISFAKDGTKVTKCIPDAITMSSTSMKEICNIVSAAKIFKKLHNCGMDTGVKFEVFEMAERYIDIIKENNVEMFSDFDEISKLVLEMKKRIEKECAVSKVPCHNDPLCENWVLGRNQMYLIDWEYAGMNDPMWDLAAVSLEAEYANEQDALMLSEYLGHETQELELYHFVANKVFVDYLWALWAKTRVPFDGQPMEDWAQERYLRLKKNVEIIKGGIEQ